MLVAAAILFGIGMSMPTGDIWQQRVIEDFDNTPHTSAFNSWKRHFNKKYSDNNEEGARFIQFMKNWELINDHNKLYEQGKETYYLGLNQFADMNVEEFQVYVHGHSGSCVKSNKPDFFHVSTAVKDKRHEHKKEHKRKHEGKHEHEHKRHKHRGRKHHKFGKKHHKRNHGKHHKFGKNHHKKRHNNNKKHMNLNTLVDEMNKEFEHEFHQKHAFKTEHDEIDFKFGNVQGSIKLDEFKLRRLKEEAVPNSIDWTNINGSSYVTPVKNQGQCGSCWAFSTTGSIESRSAIKNGETGKNIPTLSEQQLVDCSKAEGNQGCNGGLMEDAFKYVQKEGGLCTEAEYPYTAKDGTCKASSCGKKVDPITGYKVVQKDSETSLQSAVADGPVSVSVDAAGTTWQFYRGGVVTGQCGILLDHGVLAVGYGHDSSANQDYWKVKNSWGVTWGEQGYIRLCRNCDKNGNMGECGILRDDSYPTV